MSKKFVISIDTQGDFMMESGKLPVAGAQQIIAPLMDFMMGLKPEEIEGVLFTFDTHTEEAFIGSPENLGNPDANEPGFPIHCELGTPGWANVINPDLVPGEIQTFLLTKGVFNMWAQEPDVQTGFGYIVPVGVNAFQERDEFFESLKANGIDTVVVVGVAADFCVKWAVDGLVARGFKVEIVGNLTKGIIRQIDQVVAEDYPAGSVVIV